MLGLLPKFSLHLRVYSAHLDPQCVGVCPIRFGRSAHMLRDCIPMIVCVSIKLVVSTMGVAPMASQASREGGVVWQAHKT
jgi:hypothetical protein